MWIFKKKVRVLTQLLTYCVIFFQDGKMLVWDAFTTNKVHLLHIDLYACLSPLWQTKIQCVFNFVYVSCTEDDLNIFHDLNWYQTGTCCNHANNVGDGLLLWTNGRCGGLWVRNCSLYQIKMFTWITMDLLVRSLILTPVGVEPRPSGLNI